MASWQTIQSVLIFFGPLLLPRALAYYRSIRNRPKAQLKPLDPATNIALGLLFISATVAFLSTLPFFQPANIFTLTKSRLHTPAGVLMTRLGALRPLTDADQTLRKVFDAGGLEARLLYARFGPGVALSNPLVSASAPSYDGTSSSGRSSKSEDLGTLALTYATPALLAPHVLHVLVLGLATSALLSGREAARWRVMAVIAGLVLAVAEFIFIATYDDSGNARSTRVSEIDFVFWKVAVWRGLGIALVDAGLAGAMWAQGTGRAFGAKLSANERIGGVLKGFDDLMGKARALGVIRNGVCRDAELRNQVQGYWVKEGEVMKNVFEQPDVLQAQRNALKKIDTVRVGREAESFLNEMLPKVQPGQGELQQRQ